LRGSPACVESTQSLLSLSLCEWALEFSRSHNRIRATLALTLALILAALGTQYYKQEMRFAAMDRASLDLAETFYVPPVSVLKTLSLGHQGFVADLLYIKAFHYFVNHLFGDRRYQWLDTYVERIVALDPRVPTLYRWASQSAKMGQMITQEALEKSNEYAEMGLEHFPDNWTLYLDIGFNYFYELAPKAESLVDEKRYMDLARDYFAIASALPGSSLDPNFVTELFMENNDTKMALFHAYSRYMDASDAEREELRNRIRLMENADIARTLEQQDALWKENLPFVTRPFFELIGSPGMRRVPVSWGDLDGLEVSANEFSLKEQ